MILGNPENRRVIGFCEALHNAGERFGVYSWQAFLEWPRRLLDAALSDDVYLRIDTLGENIPVQQRLLEHGRWAGPPGRWKVASASDIATLPERFGILLCPHQQHRGFLAALRNVDELAPGHWRMLNPTATIRLCFDKRESAKTIATLGLPIPEVYPVDVVEDLPEIPGGVVIKLSSGSSASGLGIWRRGRMGMELFTTMEYLGRGRIYNSLRPRAYRGKIARELVALILNEGVHVERFVPKAEMDGQNFDLRVLLVAGEPAFTVIRQSRHPITNLHLGGTRGDLARLAEVIPEGRITAMYEAMRVLGRAIPGLHLGVDVMFDRDPEPGTPGFRILEINAFGDLLPGLTRTFGGREWGVYDWEIRAAMGGG